MNNTIAVNPENKVALITGANRGIGKAITIAFLDAGASKVYAGTRDLSILDELKEKYGERLVPVQLDVTNRDDVKAVQEVATDIQILVNNAGVGAFGGFFDENYKETLQQNYAVNVFGLIDITHALSNALKNNKNTAVVNISSVAGLGNMPVVGTYSSSKAAAHSITQGMRAELASHNVLVAGVYPGPIDTRMAENFDMEKASPESVAQEIISGLQNGAEDIYPDPMSKQVGEGYSVSPKGIEKQFGGFVEETTE